MLYIANKNLRYTWFVIVLVFTLSLLAHYGGLLDKAERLFYDINLYYRTKMSIPSIPAVTIVEINDSSVASLNKPLPWSRVVYARALRSLRTCNPAVVGATFPLTGSKDRHGDLALQQELKHFPHTVLVSNLSNNGSIVSETKPHRLFGRAGAYGFGELHPDPDGTLRHATLLYPAPDRSYISFPLVVAAHYLKKDISDLSIQKSAAPAWMPDFCRQKLLDRSLSSAITGLPHSIPINNEGVTLINFPGKTTAFPVVSFSDLFDETFMRKNNQLFKKRIILIGDSFDSSQGLYRTPIGSSYPAVYVHAYIIDSLLRNNLIRKPSPLPLSIGLFAFTAITGLIIRRLPPRKAVVAGIAMLLPLAFSSALLLWGWNITIPVAAPGVAVFLLVILLAPRRI